MEDSFFNTFGRELAFVSDRDGDLEVFVMAADGSDVRQVTRGPDVDTYSSWSPDGSRIVTVGTDIIETVSEEPERTTVSRRASS